MARIFISYKRVDKDTVFKIKDRIESALGERCWVDVDGVESGTQFANTVLNAMDNSSIVLFFYGCGTDHSQWQRREWEYAKENGKTIIPIILSDIPENSWYNIHLENLPFIKYTDDSCTDLILKEISAVLQIEHSQSETQNERRHVITYRPNDAPPSPVSAAAAISTKRFRCGCLIALVVVLIGIPLFRVLHFSASNSPRMPIKGVRQALNGDRDVKEAHTGDYTWQDSSVKENTAKPSKDSIPQSSEKTDRDQRNQGFSKRYNTKYLMQLSDVELDREYARAQTIEDSLYECLSKDANASYDLREIHRYQLLIREAQVTRRASAVADTIEANNFAKDIAYDHLCYNNSSEKESLHVWIWLAGLGAVVLLGIPIMLMRKKKKKRNQGEEVPPLFAQKKEIKIFIAGSTRLLSERETLRATISKMYNQHKSDNLVVEAYEFDDFTREFVEGGQQKLYDNFIRNEANWVVFITDGTIGDKTIWELENAIKVHKETGRPKILMYSTPQNITENQKEQMSQFKSILNREDNYWIDYEDVNTIRSTFREHLEWDLINLMKQELRRGSVGQMN